MLLANAMKKIYLDEELAEKFGNNARKRFDDLFTADKMGSSYLDVYEKLVKQRKKILITGSEGFIGKSFLRNYWMKVMKYSV